MLQDLNLDVSNALFRLPRGCRVAGVYADFGLLMLRGWGLTSTWSVAVS